MNDSFEQRQTTSLPQGSRASIIWNLDGIRLGHSVSTSASYGSLPSSSTAEVVRMHFGLRGDYKFTWQQAGKTFDLVGSHHNIMYSKGFDMVVENKTLELETFGIQFSKEKFLQFTTHADDNVRRFAEEVMSDKTVVLTPHWGAINPAIQKVIQQIIHCRYSGEVKKLFLLSKSVELLVLCAEACMLASAKKEAFIKTRADKEKLIAVRDLVNERASSPPNLSEIAKAVGLNEYKLKRGFKETFNTTVFGYLTEQRLHLANQYLLDTQKTAAEISMELGYATPQHFNNAFKRKFGITPSAAKNNP